jgi:hypothetical protein
VRIAPEFSSFFVGGPSLHLGVVGPYLIQGVWFPNCLPLEGIGPYPDLLGCNQRPEVPRVRHPHSSPEPSVQRVARSIHSTGGRIGTYMSLRVPSRDSIVKLCG